MQKDGTLIFITKFSNGLFNFGYFDMNPVSFPTIPCVYRKSAEFMNTLKTCAVSSCKVYQ